MAKTTKRARTRPAPAKAPLLKRTPVLEWVTAALGLVMVLAALGVIVSEGLSPEDQPRIAVRAGAVSPAPQGWTVAVEAENAGGATVSGLVIEGELKGPAGEETSRVTLDYLPRRAKAEAVLAFRADPRQGQLTVAAKGWSTP